MNTWLRHRHPRFELGRGVIAEGGVTTQPILEHFDVLEDVPFRFVPSGVVPMVHELTREGPEEAFDTGVVPAVPSPRHAELLKHDINLFAYHLPLDAHPTLGNNAQLGLKLEIGRAHV